MRVRLFTILALFLSIGFLANASVNLDQKARLHISATKSAYNLNDSDVAGLEITDMYRDEYSGITHIWYRQTINGIGIKNTLIGIHLKDDGSVIEANGEGILNAASLVKTSPSSAGEVNAAFKSSLNYLNLGSTSAGAEIKVIEKSSKYKLKIQALKGISEFNIPAELCYEQISSGEIKLVWRFYIDDLIHNSQWDISVDALTGQVISNRDMVIRCHFPHGKFEELEASESSEHVHKMDFDQPVNMGSRGVNDGSKYRVYPLGIESPAHGSRILVENPADPIASPFGWHDTNNATGPEFTHTRGNNVRAYADLNSTNPTNVLGPDGGAALTFDYPINFTTDPKAEPNRSAATTNLFYWSNIMHDITYQYGFTEAAGNFQANNYGKGGRASDQVLAEAMDGANVAANRNNANFSVSTDGTSGRMQMYLWDPITTTIFTVQTPSSIAGTYPIGTPEFGPQCSYDVTGELVLFNNGAARPNIACTGLLPSDISLRGKVALIERGGCPFVDKVRNAQTAGAIGVVIFDSIVAPNVLNMAGTNSSINIPSVFVTRNNGLIFKNNLSAPMNVNLKRTGINNCVELDGDYDGGIIAHEYGHGVSGRLTGGPSTICLTNSEQMGEGWSDFYALALTVKPGQNRNTKRGIGTYAIGEPNDGRGIREYPYTCDMSLNPHTYVDIKQQFIEDADGNVSVSVHGVGSIWCAMLWEMYWNLVDKYGYDNNLYTGTGGNNIAMRLVTEALKLQPCSPGFVTGRNAILKADSNLYGGANSCLIWQAFAKRGLGVNASQGSASSYTDGSQDFTLPAACNQTVKANFGANATSFCTPATVIFRDSSTGNPSTWAWTFGNGQTSNAQNPTVTYNTPGTYTVKLVVTNSQSTDSLVRVSYITVKPSPATFAGNDVSVCAGATTTLTASGATTYVWTGGPSTAAYTVSPSNTTSYIVTGTTDGCSKSDTVMVTVKPLPNANAGEDQTICSGQSVTLTASGGGNYTWSNGPTTAVNTVSPAATTSYIVTVTADGCSDKDTVVVSVNPPPVANAGADVAICEGETVTLTATGGANYTWSTGETSSSINVKPTTTTTYIVTASVGTCSDKDTVVVTVNTSPTVDAGADQTICAGAAATLTANGTGTFTWSTSQTGASITVSPTTTTKYFVTVTSGSGTCSSRTDSVTVNVTQAPVVVASDDISTCAGTTVTLSASGADTYLWSNGETTASISVSSVNSTVYTVTGSLTACPSLSGTDSTTVTIVEAPVAGFSYVLNGLNAAFTNTSTGATSYEWRFGLEGAQSTDVNPSYTYPEAGEYIVKLSAKIGGCSSSFTDTITVVGSGIKEVEGLRVFNIFPNPNKGNFTMEVNLDRSSDIEVAILSTDGRVLAIKRFEKTNTIKHEFDLSWLPAGTYIVDLNINQQHSFKKVIKY